MVPSGFIFLDTLSLTPNGKIDREALPMPAHDGFEVERFYAVPRNTAEQIIAGIWAEILGTKQISIHDNFFDLGGHSLKATQVISRLRRAFQSEMPLRHMFEFPTIAELANAILAQPAATQTVAATDGILTEIEESGEKETELKISE
jgi:acyl carrier protein